jgi:ParB/RepB/Spo0J family partition protein
MIYAIPLDRITNNPWQTRQADNQEYIMELAQDIRANGLLQTPLGRLTDEKGEIIAYEILPRIPDAFLNVNKLNIQLAFGHNRLAAYKLLAEQDAGRDDKFGYDMMPVEIRDLTDEQMADAAWSENEKRRDHTPLERALAIQKRIDSFAWTHDQVAEHLGISRSAVSNCLRLLKLPEGVQAQLQDGSLSERQAMALLPLYDLPQELLDAAERSGNDRVYGAYSVTPARIVAAAIDGKSSDEIRRMIDEIINRYSKRLEKSGWPLEAKKPFETIQGLKSLDCKSCQYLIVRDKERRCLAPICFKVKEETWSQFRLSQASEASGIPPLEADSEQAHGVPLTRFGWSDYKYLPTVRAGKCENLRLTLSSFGDEKENHLTDLGYSDVEIICIKRSGHCSCLQGAHAAAVLAAEKVQAAERAANAPEPKTLIQVYEEQEQAIADPAPAAPTAGDLQELARQARAAERAARKQIDAIRQQAIGILAQALAENHLGAWKMIYTKCSYSESCTAEDLESVRLAVADKIVAAPFDGQKASHYIQDIKNRFNAYGLPEISLDGEESAP